MGTFVSFESLSLSAPFLQLSIRIMASSDPDAAPGNIYSLSVPGTTFSQIIDDLRRGTSYNISVEAGHNGNFGPAAWKVFTTDGRAPPARFPFPLVL